MVDVRMLLLFFYSSVLVGCGPIPAPEGPRPPRTGTGMNLVYWTDAQGPEAIRLGELLPIPADECWGPSNFEVNVGGAFIRYLERKPQFDHLYLYLSLPATDDDNPLRDGAPVLLEVDGEEAVTIELPEGRAAGGTRMVMGKPHHFLLVPLSPGQYSQLAGATHLRGRVGKFHSFEVGRQGLSRLTILLRHLPDDLRFLRPGTVPARTVVMG